MFWNKVKLLNIATFEAGNVKFNLKLEKIVQNKNRCIIDYIFLK